ncbi:MAG: TerC family protein [Formivibrio sp.]|nr:TerC family protein [Formivibrio sp.]
MEFWIALMQIMMVNIVLSGDNAVVIALAARGLPLRQQKTAILWGSGGAVVLRIILTVVAVALLKIPFLQFIGGLLLVWIAYQLLTEEEEVEGTSHHGHGNLMSAVKTILIADVVMSLDNTLAIAGVAKGNYLLLGVGLALSIPLVVFGSTLIMRLMDRFPIIVYIGAGLIAYTAGEMIDSDLAVQPYLPSFLQGEPYLAIALTITIVGYGWWCNTRRGRTPHDVLVADEEAAERLEDKIN